MNQQLRSLLTSLSGLLERSRLGRRMLLVTGRLVARAVTQRPVDFQYVDGCWFRIDDGASIPLGGRFNLNRGAMLTWEPRGEEMSRLRRIWWFRHYRPTLGDFVLDIGAGRGEDTCVLSTAVGQSGKVVAIEAHPKTYAILDNFVRLNQLPNVFVEHCAVSDHAGSCFITEETEELWQCASLKRGGGAGSKVPAKRIDDLPQVMEARNIAFLKMNIEGAEVDALQGAHDTLGKTKSVCVCCHDFLGEHTKTKSAVQRLLAGHGFHLSYAPAGSPPYERDFVYGTR